MTWRRYGGKVMVYSRQKYGLSHTKNVIENITFAAKARV
jgi:hypothetical protein